MTGVTTHCVSRCVSMCAGVCWDVTEREQTHSLDLSHTALFTEAANQLFSNIDLHSISCCGVFCVWTQGVKGQNVSGFSSLIMRVHKMNDSMHHMDICAHTRSLAFWLMCVHACVWMKCTIDSRSLARPTCFWRSASWEMAEWRNLCVCKFLHNHTQ